MTNIYIYITVVVTPELQQLQQSHDVHPSGKQLLNNYCNLSHQGHGAAAVLPVQEKGEEHSPPHLPPAKDRCGLDKSMIKEASV